MQKIDKIRADVKKWLLIKPPRFDDIVMNGKKFMIVNLPHIAEMVNREIPNEELRK